MVYMANALVEQKEMDYLNELLTMDCGAIYDKYGIGNKEVIYVSTAYFGNGVIVDIKVCMCDDDETPYVDTILFSENKDGSYSEENCEVVDEPFANDTKEPFVEYERNGDIYKVFVVAQ